MQMIIFVITRNLKDIEMKRNSAISCDIRHHNGGGRFVGLDLIRIALALLIFLFHSHIHFKCDYYFFNDFIRMGAISMTGFLMLSGYCLHLTYSNKDLTKLYTIKIFYIKRIIAILPLYYFIAIAYSIYGTADGIISMKENILLFPIETLCLQSTFSSLFAYTHNGGTWFISCIAICYLAYPYLQELLSQMSNKAKVYLAIVLWGVLCYSPIVQHAFHLQMLYTNPFFRLLEFTIGVIIAQINYSNSSHWLLKFLRTRMSLLAVLFFLFLSVSLFHAIGVPADYMLYDCLVIPSIVGLLIPLGTMPLIKLQDNRWVLYMSSIAFTFFICQIGPVWKYSGMLCEMIGTDINILKITISFLYCLIGAILIHELVEKPVSKYLKTKLL